MSLKSGILIWMLFVFISDANALNAREIGEFTGRTIVHVLVALGLIILLRKIIKRR